MILQRGGGGVVSVCKHAQDHDGRIVDDAFLHPCLLYTSPSPRDATLSRMPSSA